MYQKVLIKLYYPAFLFLILLCFLSSNSKAQISLTGQIRARAEIRDGTGTLRPVANNPAALISQRSRLTFNYRSNKLIFQAAVQDVRVWGQDASTISNADGNRLGLHEAWAEIILSGRKDTSFKKPFADLFSFKVGRQELIYDDQRLLGNLDWLQQGRRHDAIVFKLLKKSWQFDLGAAFNQNTDAFNYNGTFYTPANIAATVKDSRGNVVNTPAGLIPLINASGLSTKNGNPSFINPPGTNGLNQNYKAMQFIYIAKTIKKAKISALFFTDQFGRYQLDSVANTVDNETGYVYGRRFNTQGVNTRLTTGLLINTPLDKKKYWGLHAGAYYQTGKDRDAARLDAYTTTVSLAYAPGKLSYTAGWDYLSGNDAFSASQTNHKFDPLYGTPHKFWGYMDYFYAGTGSPAGGLSNPFFKFKYTAVNNFWLGLDYHYFALASNQKDVAGNPLKDYLGSEFDLVANCGINKFTNVEAGFSYLAASSRMEYAKNITPGTTRLNPVWSYLQLNIKPDFFSK